MGNATFEREINDFGAATHRLVEQKRFWWLDALAPGPEVNTVGGQLHSATGTLFIAHAEALDKALKIGNEPSVVLAGSSMADPDRPFTRGEELLADIVMRAMEVAQARGWNLGAAIRAKFLYNRSLPVQSTGKLF